MHVNVFDQKIVSHFILIDSKKISIYFLDQIACPMLFDGIQQINTSIEMFIISINRSIVYIKCKHPEYTTEIKVIYQCKDDTQQWESIYENNNFTCRKLY